MCLLSAILFKGLNFLRSTGSDYSVHTRGNREWVSNRPLFLCHGPSRWDIQGVRVSLCGAGTQSAKTFKPIPTRRNGTILLPADAVNQTDTTRCSHLEEGEVAVAIDAGDLQIAHDDLAVLVELLQGTVLLVQVRQSAQLVLRARTN